MRHHRQRGHRTYVIMSAVLMAAGPARAAVTLVQNSSTNWTITNGELTVVFNPSKQNINSIKPGVGANIGPELLYVSSGKGTLDQQFSGTPFGSGPQTFNVSTDANNTYMDVWTTTAANGAANPIGYSFHYLLFDNDPTIHVYEALTHSASDPASSVGQGQFLFRADPALFNTTYQQNTGPNNMIGVQAPFPSADPTFATLTGQAGRTVQDVTYDLTGSSLAGDNGTNFFTKYDTSAYSQFTRGQTLFGPNYSVTAVMPSLETFTGGPTKQNLTFTDPGIVNLEFLSDHYGIDFKNSQFPGYGYSMTGNMTKLFGPYAFHIAPTAGKTGAQLLQDAITAIPNYATLYETDAALAAAGYVSRAAGVRGDVQVNASSSAGWSNSAINNTIVLSDNKVNMQESHQGYQYWAQLNQSGAGSMTQVVPGTYRATIYQLGQWGETRIDNVAILPGTNPVLNVAFVPENFGSAPPIWTIGTPDRSAHEFLNGHNAAGNDQRQYQGAYDFWKEEHDLGNDGKVVYYGTAVGITTATNDPNKWIATDWRTFNPGLYDSANGTTDNYSNVAPAYVRDAAHGGTGIGPANYHGSPWEIHFTVTDDQLAQGQYVVISVGAATLQASMTLTLNGHALVWSFNNFAGANTPQSRSGDAAFYQWAAFEFPTSFLNSAGMEDLLTIGIPSQTAGFMFDALRMEITDTSANPNMRGWYDYNYIAPGFFQSQDVPEPASLLLLISAGALCTRRRRRNF